MPVLKAFMQQNSCQRQALIKLARAEGQQKNQGNDFNAGPTIEKYLAPIRKVLSINNSSYLNVDRGFDWCAAFVFYLVNQCGYNVPVMPILNSDKTMGLVGIWYHWATINHKYHTNKEHPVAGDIILFDELLSSSELDHMGIVIETTLDVIITAEGNINRSTGIFNRKYDKTFRGFIRL